jgi:hypothetical protein
MHKILEEKGAESLLTAFAGHIAARAPSRQEMREQH